MSIVIVTGDKISKNPLNTSKSKQLYSFPKSERFRDTKVNLCDKFYDVPRL
jgi:hypothetical protein